MGHQWNSIYEAKAGPSRARITFDYSYGLSLEDVPTALDVTNVQNTIEIRLLVRNLANGPMKLLVERIHITIEDRFFTLPAPFTAIIPRAAATTLFSGGGLTKEAFEKFADRTRGTLEYSILYGHPEDQLSRRVTKILRLEIVKRKNDKGELSVSSLWHIQKETDIAI